MKPLDLTNYHRSSMRLPEHDYSAPGIYAITICTRGHECMFGEITDGIMSLSEMGEIAKECWLEIPLHFHHTVLDAWVIMPNHLHGILILDYAIHEPEDLLPDRQLENPVKDSKAASIGVIVGSYKSAVSHLMNEHNGNSGSSIWQRNYYDHIIRNTAEFERTRRYLALNPVRWDSDPENIRLTSVHV